MYIFIMNKLLLNKSVGNDFSTLFLCLTLLDNDLLYFLPGGQHAGAQDGWQITGGGGGGHGGGGQIIGGGAGG